MVIAMSYQPALDASSRITVCFPPAAIVSDCDGSRL